MYKANLYFIEKKIIGKFSYLAVIAKHYHSVDPPLHIKGLQGYNDIAF